MQRRAGGQAGAPRVAGVPVDLGMDEHDMDRQRHLACRNRRRQPSAGALTTARELGRRLRARRGQRIDVHEVPDERDPAVVCEASPKGPLRKKFTATDSPAFSTMLISRFPVKSSLALRSGMNSVFSA